MRTMNSKQLWNQPACAINAMLGSSCVNSALVLPADYHFDGHTIAEEGTKMNSKWPGDP